MIPSPFSWRQSRRNVTCLLGGGPDPLLGEPNSDLGLLHQSHSSQPPTEYRLGSRALTTLTTLLDVPPKYARSLAKEDPEFLATVLNHHLSTYPDSIGLHTSSGQLQSIYDPQAWNLDPRAIVEVVASVMDPTSTVIESSRTTKDFSFDVAVPGGYDRATLHEATPGEMRGGLRVSMRNQTNVAPSVQPYTYRLVCQNGMETYHDDLKFSARGLDLDELLVEFESMAAEP